MNLNNKLLINIAYLSIFVTVIGFLGLLISNNPLIYFLELGGVLFVMTAGYLLVKNGEFIKSREYRFIGIGVALVIVGTMFKIMHWPSAGILIIVGYSSFPLIYLIYMFRYRRYALGNVLRLLLLLSMSAGRLLRMNHWPYWQYCAYISLAIIAYLFIDFVRNKNKTV